MHGALSNYNTRVQHNLCLETNQNAIIYNDDITIYNKLPENIKNSENVNIFKNKFFYCIKIAKYDSYIIIIILFTIPTQKKYETLYSV